ncbi:unnamed protein product, partial [Callosobruchus maculatus]
NFKLGVKYTNFHQADLTAYTKFKQQIEKKWYQCEHIYTDGSKTTNGIGCGFYHENKKDQELYKLPPDCSI